MLVNSIKQFATSYVENFDSEKPEYARTQTWMYALVNIVFLAFVVLVLALVGTILWNNFLAGAKDGKGAFTIIKPLDSKKPWEILGIYVIVQLIFGGL